MLLIVMPAIEVPILWRSCRHVALVGHRGGCRMNAACEASSSFRMSAVVAASSPPRSGRSRRPRPVGDALATGRSPRAIRSRRGPARDASPRCGHDVARAPLPSHTCASPLRRARDHARDRVTRSPLRSAGRLLRHGRASLRDWFRRGSSGRACREQLADPWAGCRCGRSAESRARGASGWIPRCLLGGGKEPRVATRLHRLEELARDALRRNRPHHQADERALEPVRPVARKPTISPSARRRSVVPLQMRADECPGALLPMTAAARVGSRPHRPPGQSDLDHGRPAHCKRARAPLNRDREA